MHDRKLAFAVLTGVCVVAVILVAVLGIAGSRRDAERSERAVEAARPRAQEILTSNRPFVVYRNVNREQGASYGRTSVAALDGGKPGPRALAGPACQRVAFAAGAGLCLDVLGTKMAVRILDDQLREVRQLTLNGIPSRTRISPDGRWGGVTAFVVGHAYTSPGEFSTETKVIDLRSGKVVGDLERDFTVTRDGKVVDARDRNFWGLTFAADGDTFYATMATGGDTWLIEGSIAERRARTIHGNVECPALSPDGTRIAYKKAVARNPTRWRFHVLDLATGRETPLAETRSIDDQLSWLGDERVLYGADDKTWVVNADGSGRPEVWLEAADSPTVSGGDAVAP